MQRLYTNCLERSERLRNRIRSTNFIQRIEMLGRRDFSWIESERLIKMIPVDQLPRAKREAKKGDRSINCLVRGERQLRKSMSTYCHELSERLKRETGPHIAASEARG